jgi:hypothetical protein
VASTYRLQEQITGMMLGGATLDRIEIEVIDPSDLAPDRKAALWLWALSYVTGTDQRSQAGAYLASVGSSFDDR